MIDIENKQNKVGLSLEEAHQETSQVDPFVFIYDHGPESGL